MTTVSRALLVLALALATPATSTLSAQLRPLRLVSTAWPPFTNEAGQPRFALDLVEAALARIKRSGTTTIVEAGAFTTALLGTEFDGSGAAWRDAEREKVLLFSQPYLENRLILVGRRGDNVSASALRDLKGRRIAVVEGYSYGEALEGSGVTLIRSRSEEDSLTLLLQGKADYTLMDELVVEYIVNNYPEEARTKLSLGSTPLLTRPLHFAIRRTLSDAESLVAAFNAQLRGMMADGTYHRLLRVRWLLADVDGDGLSEFVPQSERSGANAPRRAYAVLSSDLPRPETRESPSRFYVGGTIYTDWASVPNRYKVDDPQWPDASRSTASIFTFTF
jgi:polar amino acid transport system substrate-binding protein